MNTYTRRQFLGHSLAAAAGAALLPYAGTVTAADAQEGILEVPAKGYPLVEAAGTYREIGAKLAAAMKKRILDHLHYSMQYKNSVEYLEGDGRKTVEKMLKQARKAFPQFIEEIEGMAFALDIPFERLFAFQCRSEISVLRDPPGCSTIALCRDGKAILAHNEDGSDLNIGRMFLARVTPPSGVTFLTFVYPGLMPGNGPGFNSAGVVQTTNYIQPLKTTDGIPRYFIGRAIFEAASLDEALDLVTMTPRAFSYHHNLMSLPEGRILSVEAVAYPEHKHSIKEIEGCYVHTNHFIHPGMTGEKMDGPQPFDIPYESSTTRMRVLSAAIEERGEPGDAGEMLELLSLHEGRPYSPCRHPQGDVHGVTLGTAVFTAPDMAMTLFHGNPCRGFHKKHKL